MEALYPNTITKVLGLLFTYNIFVGLITIWICIKLLFMKSLKTANYTRYKVLFFLSLSIIILSYQFWIEHNCTYLICYLFLISYLAAYALLIKVLLSLFLNLDDIIEILGDKLDRHVKIITRYLKIKKFFRKRKLTSQPQTPQSNSQKTTVQTTPAVNTTNTAATASSVTNVQHSQNHSGKPSGAKNYQRPYFQQTTSSVSANNNSTVVTPNSGSAATTVNQQTKANSVRPAAANPNSRNSKSNTKTAVQSSTQTKKSDKEPFLKPRHSDKTDNNTPKSTKTKRRTYITIKSKAKDGDQIKVENKIDIPTQTRIPSDIPGLNDNVYVEGKEMLLRKEIGSGGEGNCYLVSNVIVAKIFDVDDNTTIESINNKREKITHLINLENKNRTFCFPKDYLTNSDGDFVGYTMYKANGSNLNDILFNVTKMAKFMDLHGKKGYIKTCITLINLISEVHKLKLIVADLNLFNIMIKDPKKLCLIDTDSFQINNLKGEVGKEEYLRPKYAYKVNWDFDRNVNDDSFSVYVVCFQLLMMGKLPYDHIGGDTYINNLKKAYFPYHPLNISNSQNIPKGPYGKLWFSLPQKVRYFFYGVFQEQKTLKMNELEKFLKEYLIQLNRKNR